MAWSKGCVLCCLLAFGIGSAGADPGVTQSTFDDDLEGWASIHAGTAATHNPEGHICANDAYWKAPLAFTGDFSDAYGGELTFDLKQNQTGSQQDTSNDVMLVGNDITLYFNIRDNPGTSWTTYRVPLDETAGWTVGLTTEAPTREEFLAVLSSISTLRIRGSFSGYAEQDCIDNVSISAVAPSRPAGTTNGFDADGQNWATVASGSAAKWASAGGNPRGHLCANDAYWKAPLDFLGDLSAAYGRALTFDLKQNQTGSQQDTSDDVILIGRGMEFHFNTPDNPGLGWTSYRVPLDELAGWTIGTTEEAPTRDEFLNVLSSISTLRIRGNFSGYGELDCIDNVVIDTLPDARPVGVSETFDNDESGWSITAGDALQWELAGGNPRGHVCASDAIWTAPPAFLGDLSAAYGRALTFDLKQNQTGSQRDTSADVVLIGQGTELRFDTRYNAGLGWTPYRIPLDEQAGWTLGETGERPTSDEFLGVLSSVETLLIRGDFSGYGETDCIDNVILQSASSSLPQVGLTLTGSGRVISADGQLDCPGTCSATYENGTSLTLTATPETGWEFAGWDGACTGTTPTCDLSVNGALAVTAEFQEVAAAPQVLAVSLMGSGSVVSTPAGIDCGGESAACIAEFDSGTQVRLTATPAAGAVFSGWGGACSGALSTCTIILDRATSVSAVFAEDGGNTPPPVLAVSAIGGGRVTSADGRIGCPNACIAEYGLGDSLVLTATPSDGWQFLGWGGVCTGTAPCSLTLTANAEVFANFTQLSNRYQLDSPVNGSFESGIGVVYGWVCEADRVSLQVDELTPFEAAYGAVRADSQSVCGDAANGFAAAINWSEYGDGEHRLKLLADGQALAEARVSVTTLGVRYLRNLSATTRMADFPSAGLQTTLAWSEPHQNFVAADASALSSASPSLGSGNGNGNWESPLVGGFESGRALIRGWVCDASNISVTLDGTVLSLPYGSARADTLDQCGDSDNGYALAINWNDYGDGEHQIALVIDGDVAETRTFLIATPAGQGTVSGVQGQHSLSDFPNPGDSLTLQWSEPHQNFRLASYRSARDETVWRVAEIYVATLGFAPDQEGLRYWADNIDHQSEWTPTTVAQSFFDQPLVQAQYPAGQSVDQLIEALYQNLFGRAADVEGLAYWRDELDSGRKARNQMIVALIDGGWGNESAEARADMQGFGHRLQVSLAFADYQAEHGILYSALSADEQDLLRQVGTDILRGVTADLATRDAAIAQIPILLGPLSD